MNRSSMDRILVTGGTSFSGLHLVRSLVREGHAVRVLTPSLERARALLPAETEIMAGDITERADVDRAMEGREVVYHLADSAGMKRVADSARPLARQRSGNAARDAGRPARAGSAHRALRHRARARRHRPGGCERGIGVPANQCVRAHEDAGRAAGAAFRARVVAAGGHRAPHVDVRRR